MTKILEKEKKSEYQKEWYVKNKARINKKSKIEYETKKNERKIKRLALQCFKILQEIDLLRELHNKKNMELYALGKIEHDKKNPNYANFFAETRKLKNDSLGFVKNANS